MPLPIRTRPESGHGTGMCKYTPLEGPVSKDRVSLLQAGLRERQSFGKPANASSNSNRKREVKYYFRKNSKEKCYSRDYCVEAR
jgi:hypothetical protein